MVDLNLPRLSIFAQGDADEILLETLDRAVQGARLRIVLPDRAVTVGASGAPRDHADYVLRVRDPGFCRRVLVEGNLGLAESFMEEGWTLEEGSLEGLLTVLLESGIEEKLRRDPRNLARVALMRVEHALRTSRENIRLHYDLGDDLYDAFLDEHRAYTCGYQKREGESLQEIQENKFDRVCEKLRLEEGHTLFDVGCGYGGFLIHAARKWGARGRGITVSKAQAEGAMRRVRELGLEGRVTVEFGDFRQARGVYDRVTSIGMLEHLYPHHYPAFLQTVSRLLHDDGVALVQTIGRHTTKIEHDAFTQRYLFPGSTHPLPSDLMRAIEEQGMPLLDMENIVRSYQPTTRYWLANFRRNRHTLDPARYDVRFQRMFEYYLAMCVAATHALVASVFQVLFTKNLAKNISFQRV